MFFLPIVKFASLLPHRRTLYIAIRAAKHLCCNDKGQGNSVKERANTLCAMDAPPMYMMRGASPSFNFITESNTHSMTTDKSILMSVLLGHFYGWLTYDNKHTKGAENIQAKPQHPFSLRLTRRRSRCMPCVRNHRICGCRKTNEGWTVHNKSFTRKAREVYISNAHASTWVEHENLQRASFTPRR